VYANKRKTAGNKTRKLPRKEGRKEGSQAAPQPNVVCKMGTSGDCGSRVGPPPEEKKKET